MTRSGLLILCVSLGAGLLACGSNSPSPSGGGSAFLGLFPQASTVAGWVVNPSSSKTSSVVAATATTQAGTEALIDGAAADFFQPPSTPVEFGWQNYLNTTVTDAPAAGVTLSLYILQMPSAAQASALYASLMNDSLYSTWSNPGATDPDQTWSDPSSPPVGDQSRLVNAGDTWWINFCKGVYYVEVALKPSYGPAPAYTQDDPNLESAAFAFAQAVAKPM